MLSSDRAPLSLELAWRSDTGLVRAHNEDAVAVDGPRGLVAIADGVGGAAGGGVASDLAVRAVLGWLQEALGRVADGVDPLDLLTRAVAWGNAEVCREARETPGLAGMSTTLVVGMFLGGWLVYGHVGDSRLYLCRGGQLQPLTRDHSLCQEAVEGGRFRTLEEARRAGIPTNIITRVVGAEDLRGPDTRITPLERGDLYLFCTDGLTKGVSDAELESLLATTTSLEGTADELVRRAYAAGGEDNISLVLVRFRAT